jgi:hypothetical protein
MAVMMTAMVNYAELIQNLLGVAYLDLLNQAGRTTSVA